MNLDTRRSDPNVFQPSRLRLALLAAILPIGFSQSVFAEQAIEEDESLELEEILVTAQKRTQTLQEVPISVSALNGEKMNEAGITNLESLAAHIPNFSINQTGISTSIRVRGINSGINQGFEQSVGMYVDGIYYGRSQLARAPLLDLERVEVLRGPQSILFGKNSIAGSVAMHTAKPTEEFEASATLLYEPAHGEEDARIILSGPIANNLGLRVAVLDRSMDGFMDNAHLNSDESLIEEQVFRSTLQWTPTDELTATLKLERAQFDVNGRNIEVIGDTAAETGVGLSTVYPIFSGGATLDSEQDFKRQANGDTSRNNTENITLQLDYQIADHTLTAISGLNAYEYNELCDCEYTSLDTFTLGLDEQFIQRSQELRITSPLGQPVEYIAGIFYQNNTLDFDDEFNVPVASALGAVSSALSGYRSNRIFDQTSELNSAFAQVTWNISDQARLNLGGRYTVEEKQASRDFVSSTTANNPEVVPGTGVTLLDLAENSLRAEAHQVAGKRNESAFTPLINVQYDLNDDTMVYTTYTTGFKAGGFDVRSNASPDAGIGVPAAITGALAQPPSPVGVFEFEEERAQTYEIGSKMSLADGAAELNAALYQTDYDDLQVSIFDGGLGFNVGNAAKAQVQGIELDGRWKATQNLVLSTAIAYLDFEFQDYDNGECYFLQGTLEPQTVTNAALDMCSFDGKRQAYTPEVTANLSADYSTQVGASLEFRANLDMFYSDEYLTSPSLDPRTNQDAFTKVNARLSLGAYDGSWEIALLGRNITDESILSYSAEVPTSSTLVGAVTGQQGLAYYGFYERPVSYSLQGTIRF